MHCTWAKAEWGYCGVATLFVLAFWRTSRLLISSQSLQMKQQMQPMTSNFQSACATWNTIRGWLKRGWACWSRKNAFYHWLCVQVFSKLFQNTQTPLVCYNICAPPFNSLDPPDKDLPTVPVKLGLQFYPDIYTWGLPQMDSLLTPVTVRITTSWRSKCPFSIDKSGTNGNRTALSQAILPKVSKQ